MPALLWVSAVVFTLLFAGGFVLIAKEAPSREISLYALSAFPIPVFMLLLLFGLAYIAGKVKRLERRLDDRNP